MAPLVSRIIDEKILRILKTLVYESKNEEQVWTLLAISQTSNVALGTTFRLVKQLCDAGFLKKVTLGKSTLYTLTAQGREEAKGIVGERR
jgi:predicted transcriptional regulator